jgi:hypothetical protein
MKTGLLLFFLLAITTLARAQDMIITQYGDTLNKKVIYSTKRYLFVVDSTFRGKYFIKGIKKSRITEEKMNAYKVDRYTAMMNERGRGVMGNPYMLQAGLHVSYTPFIPDSDATSSEKNFYQKLSVGFSYNLSFHLRMRPHSFLGVVIDDNRNKSFAEKLDIKTDNGSIAHLENITATLGMTYIGAEYLLFIDSRKFKNFFTIAGGIGYAHAKWKISALNRPADVYDFQGGAMRISISYNWAITKSLIIGPNFKLVNAIVESSDYGVVNIPRVNLGLNVFIH